MKRFIYNWSEETVNTVLTETVENQHSENIVIVQHDVAPPHYDPPFRQYLYTTFLGRWIGMRGARDWSPGSLSLEREFYEFNGFFNITHELPRKEVP